MRLHRTQATDQRAAPHDVGSIAELSTALEGHLERTCVRFGACQRASTVHAASPVASARDEKKKKRKDKEGAEDGGEGAAAQASDDEDEAEEVGRQGCREMGRVGAPAGPACRGSRLLLPSMGQPQAAQSLWVEELVNVGSAVWVHGGTCALGHTRQARLPPQVGARQPGSQAASQPPRQPLNEAVRPVAARCAQTPQLHACLPSALPPPQEEGEDEGVVWMTDTSAQAVAARAAEQLTAATAQMVTQGNIEAEAEKERRRAEKEARKQVGGQQRMGLGGLAWLGGPPGSAPCNLPTSSAASCCL